MTPSPLSRFYFDSFKPVIRLDMAFVFPPHCFDPTARQHFTDFHTAFLIIFLSPV